VTQIQVRTICPKWQAQKEKNPKLTRDQHLATYPDCGCGAALGEQWTYEWVDLAQAMMDATVDKYQNIVDVSPARPILDPDPSVVIPGTEGSANPALEGKKRRGRPPKVTVSPEFVDPNRVPDLGIVELPTCSLCGAFCAGELCGDCGVNSADAEAAALLG
jgi:hypothetical protein